MKYVRAFEIGRSGLTCRWWTGNLCSIAEFIRHCSVEASSPCTRHGRADRFDRDYSKMFVFCGRQGHSFDRQ